MHAFIRIAERKKIKEARTFLLDEYSLCVCLYVKKNQFQVRIYDVICSNRDF